MIEKEQRPVAECLEIEGGVHCGLSMLGGVGKGKPRGVACAKRDHRRPEYADCTKVGESPSIPKAVRKAEPHGFGLNGARGAQTI